MIGKEGLTDGVTEAYESTDPEWFCHGVQWHPEYMPQRRDQRRLFQSFVDYCRDLRSR